MCMTLVERFGCEFETQREKELTMQLLCIFCHQNGEQVLATYIAPQDNNDETWSYEPVCDNHMHDWWDGSDYPDGVGAPAIIPISTNYTERNKR